MLYMRCLPHITLPTSSCNWHDFIKRIVEIRELSSSINYKTAWTRIASKSDVQVMQLTIISTVAESEKFSIRETHINYHFLTLNFHCFFIRDFMFVCSAEDKTIGVSILLLCSFRVMIFTRFFWGKQNEHIIFFHFKENCRLPRKSGGKMLSFRWKVVTE